MYINAEQLNKLDNELLDVALALVKGEAILEHDPVDGWFQTTQINMHLSRADYHIGEYSPK